ncbi:hypothetical protein EYR40_002339 [Pleurotus pulmonarius]|nr:hypothetical protein EYR40_002339 [Pleurotus pulmonarius]
MWYPKRLLYWSIYKMTPSGNTKHKALLIGISDDGSGQPLSVGPRNDVKKMRKLLRETYSYKNSDIVVMYDKQRDPKLVPTRENILREIDNLVAGCKAGDHIVFHYSGHSGQQDNLDGTEKDGKDERIETKTGPILDDVGRHLLLCEVELTLLCQELRARLIDPLCPGAQLVRQAVLDTCHSETLLGNLTTYYTNRSAPYQASDLPHVECQSPPLSPDKHTVKETIKEDMRVTINDPVLEAIEEAPRPSAILETYQIEEAPSLAESAYETNSVFSPDLIQPNSDFYGEYCCHKECSPLEKDQVRKEVSELAQVVRVVSTLAISSCKDSQYSYEDAEGKGMTDPKTCSKPSPGENNPHPTVEKLFNVICFSLFTPAWDRIHSEGWDEYRREFDEDALPNAYQEPSLSSLQRLVDPFSWYRHGRELTFDISQNLEHTLSL